MQGLRMASYFGRLNYAFADEIFIRDESSCWMPPPVSNEVIRWGVFSRFLSWLAVE